MGSRSVALKRPVVLYLEEWYFDTLKSVPYFQWKKYSYLLLKVAKVQCKSTLQVQVMHYLKWKWTKLFSPPADTVVAKTTGSLSVFLRVATKTPIYHVI